MVTAKCNRCLGSATAETFEEARNNINHAVGLSRGIKCGDNYNFVVEIVDESKEKSYHKVKDASLEKTHQDESPPDADVKPKTENSNYKTKTKSTKNKE